MGKLAGIAVSLILLAIIYWQIDVQALLAALASADPSLLLLGAAVVVPITVITGVRLCLLVPDGVRLGVGEATRLILMAAVLNLVLPSKLGDLAKAYALAEDGRMRRGDALALVVLEKILETAAMLAWCMVGLVLAWPAAAVAHGLAAVAGAVFALCVVAMVFPGFACAFLRAARRIAPRSAGDKLHTLERSWRSAVARLWAEPQRAGWILLASLASWLMHMTQIWLFALALGAAVPFAANLALAPLAILVGLLPLTMAGVGTRDAAVILVYQPYMAAPVAAALGLLFTLRYVLPALAGWPFLARYLTLIRRTRHQAHAPLADT
jgi:uncharacterized protein (TIRG00374 family)